MIYDIIKISTRNLFRYKSKTLSMLIPIILTIFIFSAMMFIQKGLQKDAYYSTQILPDITVQKMTGGRVERIDMTTISKIKTIKEIKKIVPRVWGYVPVKHNKNVVAFTLMGIDITNTDIPKKINLILDKGRFLNKNNIDEALVGKSFAKNFNLNINDKFHLKDTFGNEEMLIITGIFNSNVQIYTADMIFVNIDKCRKFFNYSTNEATDLNIYLHNQLQADRIAGKILKVDKKLRVFTRETLSDFMTSSFNDRAGIFQILWIILLISCIIISLTQGINISIDLKKEIGILKTLGWATIDIIKMKIIESFLIGFIGTITGMIMGIVYLKMNVPGIKEYFLGWSRIFPDFNVPIYLDTKLIIIMFIIGIIPLIVSSIIPAWLIGITEPDKSIRY